MLRLRHCFCTSSWIIGVCLIAAFPHGGGAQGMARTNITSTGDWLIDVWDSERGLPENSVASLAQTPDGYLWLGTFQAGVARFDGMRFTSFDPANTPQLSRSDIQHLFLDSRGALWIATVSGSLSRYEAGRFTQESIPPLAVRDVVTMRLCSGTNDVFFATQRGEVIHGIRRPGTNSLWEKIPLPDLDAPLPCCSGSADGRIWYRRTDQRLGCWHAGKVDPLHSYEGLRGGQIRALISGPQGLTWVGTESGIGCFKGGCFVDMTPTNGEPVVSVQDLAFAGDGGLWVRTDNRLRKCIGRQWVAEAEGWAAVPVPGKSYLAGLLGDRDGGVWFCHRHEGVWRVKPDGAMQHWDDKHGLPNGLVFCWLQDREGNLWLGLEAGGLVRLRPRHFQVLRRPDAAAGSVERSVCEDAQGGIWLGGSDGKISRWFNGAFEPANFPATEIPVRDVTLWPDRQNGLWAGTVQNGAWLWKNGRMQQLFPPDDIGRVVRVIFEDSRGRMWMGNRSGLYCWSDGQIRKFSQAQGFRDNEPVVALAEDAAGSLWIGTEEGRLWRLQSGQFTCFTLLPPSPVFRFWSLLPDGDGSVWVGTLGGGLIRWRNGQMARCTSADGLPSDTISQLLSDGHGNLWAGSRAGIFSVSQTERLAFFEGRSNRVFCRAFGRSDGLPALECSAGYQPSCWRGRDDRLWFATVKGAVFVQPAELSVNPLPPTVVIESVTVDDVIQDIPSESPTLILKPGRHPVAIRFTGLSLTVPERVRFQWRLSGLEPDWVNGENQRSVSYSYLPPGDYRFEVRAGNSDGVWSHAGAALNLTVRAYFWQTIWFRLLAALLILGAAGWMVKRLANRRLRRRLAEIQQQHALEQERTRIARDIHDELGALLTGISLLSDRAQAQGSRTEQVGEQLQKISQNARSAVQSMDGIVWAINPQNDTFDSLANYLVQFAENFFRLTPIRCRLDVPEELPQMPFDTQKRHHVYLAVKEACNNVARHSGATEVWMRLSLKGPELCIAIEDNGCGFAAGKAAEGSDGLRNLRQRMAEIGGRLELVSERGQGTRVRLHVLLPESKASL